MTGRIWSGILAAGVFAATVAVAAQEPSTSQNPAPSTSTSQAPATPTATSQAPATPTTDPPTTSKAPASSAPQSSEGRRITVAGCLQAAPPSPTGTSGSAASTPAATTDAPARPETSSGDPKFVLANAVSSPPDKAAAASDSRAPRPYRLIANDSALTPHVGKKLELTGTIDDQASSATSSAASAPRLRVEAGKVVAEACTP